MPSNSSTLKNILFLAGGSAFALPALFFAYYTIRLIYINFTASAEDAAAHRTGGMLIGAIVFPVATIVFSLISWFLINKARRGFKLK